MNSNVKHRIQRWLVGIVTNNSFMKELSLYFFPFTNLTYMHAKYVTKHLRLPLDYKYRFLDAGCGQGELLMYLSRKFPKAKIFGIDLDGDKIKSLKNYCNSKKINNIVVEEENILRVDDSYSLSINAIFACDILEHVSEDVVVLQKFWDMLIPGGRLIIHVPSKTMKAMIFHSYFKNYYSRVPGHIRYGYRIEELVGKLKKCGFEIENTKYTYSDYGTTGFEMFTVFFRDVFLVRENDVKNIRVILSIIFSPIYIIFIHPLIVLLYILDVKHNNSWGNAILCIAKKREAGK